MSNELEKIHRSVGFSGILSVIFGLLILFLPNKTASIIATIVGIGFIVIGIIYLATNFIKKGDEKSKWARLGHILLGFVYLFAGLFVFIDLNAATDYLFMLVGILVGIVWIVDGIVSFTTLKNFNNKIWAVLLGILSIIGGFILVLVPVWGAKTLWLLLGIEFLIFGIVKLIHYATWPKN